MKKKRLTFAAALLLSVAVLSGCNKTGVQTATETTASSVQTTETTALQADVNAKITIDGTKFMVEGREIWINGVNTPWDKWNDFGFGFNEQFWDSHFAELREAGVNATRIWVNCDSGCAVKLKTTGEFNMVLDKHWEDLDKLFALAEKHRIYIMPTLMSFDHFDEAKSAHERWRLMIQDETLTQSFIDGYVVPFAERYGENDYLWAIDLCNEPDWIVEEAKCGKIGWEYLMPFFAELTAAIHDNSDALVTVGVAMIKYNSNTKGTNYVSDEAFEQFAGESGRLDFYSTHYYDWQYEWYSSPFEKTPEEFGLDGTKPIVIAEFSANGGERGMTPEEVYKAAYDLGYNGLMTWTSNGVDGNGDINDLKSGTLAIFETAPEKVYPLEG